MTSSPPAPLSIALSIFPYSAHRSLSLHTTVILPECVCVCDRASQKKRRTVSILAPVHAASATLSLDARDKRARRCFAHGDAGGRRGEEFQRKDGGARGEKRRLKIGGRCCRRCEMLSAARRGCQAIINITLRGLSDALEVCL